MNCFCARVILISLTIANLAQGGGKCPEPSKAHLTRCDMFYKCVKLASGNRVWIPTNCDEGLVYESTWKKCVLPADDWECRLGEDDDAQMLNDDADNIYGVNNLSYLQQQLRGYDAESNHDDTREDEMKDSETVIVSMAGALHKQVDSNSIDGNGEEQASGDGAPTADDTEIKSDFIPIPTNADASGTISTHLQRLSQIIKGLSSDQNEPFELGPDELNEFLALQKIKAELGTSNEIIISPNARPAPSNGQMNANDVNQIIDLQKKLTKLGASRDTYSTPPTPSAHSVSGNGYYPADATTIHISATNTLKNPTFPDIGYATSQIVVNRPEGSVVFSLPSPHNNHHQPQQQQTETHKHEPSISEDTLKTLLEISQQMSSSNRRPSANEPDYNSPSAHPMFQPFYYNFPSPFITNVDEEKSSENGQRPMQKISSIYGHLNDGTNGNDRPTDAGLSTIIHNHIPITISQPNPPTSIVNRLHISSTARPQTDDDNHQPSLDSYGQRRPAHTDTNHYYSYPPYENGFMNPLRPHQNSAYPTAQVPFATVSNPYGYQSSFNGNSNHHQLPSPSSSLNYVPVNSSPFGHGVIDPQHPVPSFGSDDTRFTEKYHTPSPHLNGNNVNRYVHVEAKPYQTLQSTEFIPIGSSSDPQPTYSKAPASFAQQLSGSNEESENNGSETSSDEESDDDQSLNSEYISSEAGPHSDENVMNLLANFNSAATKKPFIAFQSPSSSSSSGENHKQIVNLGGNFMSLETYQSSIEPYLQSDSPQIEVLTCATGVRQANSSDCTRYFVCNGKTGKVLSYTCPPYTAFNPDTKICNARTYSTCHPLTIRNRVTHNSSGNSNSNKKWQQEAQQTLMEAQRIKAEAVKAQHLAHLIKIETEKMISSAANAPLRNRVALNAAKATKAPLSTRPTRAHRKPLSRPQTTTVAPQTGKKSGKRKIPCRTEGKLPDALSKHNYFLCFKGSDGKMRARKMPCPSKLTFCSGSKLCTSASRCAAKKS